MKTLFAILIFVGSQSFAQNTSIKDIATDEDTTISIKKGNNQVAEKIYEVLDGSNEIEGDPHVLQKTARDNWKKACEDWKKEIKDLNKDNQVLNLTCNAPVCQKDNSASVGSTVCQSHGIYKIKVKVTK